MSENKQNNEYKNLSKVDGHAVYNQLPEYTRIAKYAQHNRNKKRRETWDEQTNRVFKMHKVKFQKHLDNPEFMELFNFAKKMILKKHVLGSQRALQFGGPSILNKETRIYNCCASYIDRPRVFQEIMFSLLCGVGVGCSVQLHHVNKLPNIIAPGLDSEIYKVDDSIEGWSDAIGILCSSFFTENQEFPAFFGKQIIFDFSLIRPAGSSISNISGKAPGPEGLCESLKKIKDIFNDCISKGFNKLRTIDAYDIIVHSSDAVLSGGVRRSALLALFSLDDDDMIKAKTGDWYIKNPQRARSNNSALLLRDKTPVKQYMDLIQSVKQFGEPGIIWTDSLETLYNPCVPQDTWILTSNGSKQVKNLINTPFKAVVNGLEYECKTGFIKTGENKQVYKIITEEGFEVRATKNHKILTINSTWVELKNLKIGDKIVVNDHSKISFTMDITDNKDFAAGWLSGNLYVSEKTGRNLFSDISYKYSVDGVQNKIPSILPLSRILTEGDYKNLSNVENLLLVESNTILFQRGFLRALFDNNGVIKEKEISFYNDSNDILKIIQRMCIRLGIYSIIHNKFNKLIINNYSMTIFYNIIGFSCPEQQKKLNNILQPFVKNEYTAKIADIIQDEICDVYDCTVDDIHAFDANGLYLHNCVEISLYGYDSEGNSGFQFCNLSEINMGTVDTPEDFYKRCKAASIIGTFQAAYTNFGYLGKVTENIVKREALLGVSMTGMMDSPLISFDPDVLDKGAKIVKEVNYKVAKIIGINTASRTTCVKPAGSTSCILGTSSGIHPCHSKRYFRRVQSNILEESLDFFKKYNSQAVELSVWSAGKTDEVITFLCKAKEGAITKNDLSAIGLLEKVKLVQNHWVKSGKNIELSVQPWLNHNVSNTITIKDDEWEGAAAFIYDNRHYFAGISMLGDSGDMTYHQAPFQGVYTHEEITKMYGAGSVFASGLIVYALKAFNNNLYAACATLLGYGEKLELPDFTIDNIKVSLVQSDKIYKKIRWVAQAKKFANRHFEGNILKMTYCLKSVDAWKTWVDLKRTYKPVPWEDFIEETDNTKPSEYYACSGGNCEIIRF